MEYSGTYSAIPNQNFLNEIPSTDKPTILVFGANWSGNSNIMDNIVGKVSSQYAKKIVFFRLDLEQNFSLAKKLRVQSVPTLFMFKNGEIKEIIKGLISAKELITKIKVIY